jgi:hypothetical protein
VRTATVAAVVVGLLVILSIVGRCNAQVKPADVAEGTNSSVTVKVDNCDTARKWFQHEAGSLITLDSRNSKAHYAQPVEPDSLDFNFTKAAYYRGNVGGGGCLGGYFDGANNIAAIREMYDTYQDNVLFCVKHPVDGFTNRKLTNSQTKRGARLGMTFEQVVAIEGAGTFERLPNGDTVLRYQWFVPMRESNLPLTYDLAFVLNGGRVIGIDYGWGV